MNPVCIVLLTLLTSLLGLPDRFFVVLQKINQSKCTVWCRVNRKTGQSILKLGNTFILQTLASRGEKNFKIIDVIMMNLPDLRFPHWKDKRVGISKKKNSVVFYPLYIFTLLLWYTATLRDILSS